MQIKPIKYIVLLAILVFVAAIIFMFVRNGGTNNEGLDLVTTPTELVTIPLPSDPLVVDTEVGAPLVLSSLVDREQAVVDPVNPDTYVLVGETANCTRANDCPVAIQANQFLLSYNSTYQSFNILLLQNPIDIARRSAVEKLMSVTNLTATEVCIIKVSVSVPQWVNEFYAGRELGIEGCPGHISLQ